MMAGYELRSPLPHGWIEIAPATETQLALEVRMLPIGPSALRAAQVLLVDASHPLSEYRHDIGFDDFSRELCRRGMIEWRGVLRGGEPAILNAENIDILLGDARILTILQNRYIGPWLEREAEKNVSAPSRAGTGPATTGAKGTAAAAPPAATNAPTSSTRRKPTKAKPAGK